MQNTDKRLKLSFIINIILIILLIIITVLGWPFFIRFDATSVIEEDISFNKNLSYTLFIANDDVDETTQPTILAMYNENATKPLEAIVLEDYYDQIFMSENGLYLNSTKNDNQLCLIPDNNNILTEHTCPKEIEINSNSGLIVSTQNQMQVTKEIEVLTNDFNYQNNIWDLKMKNIIIYQTYPFTVGDMQYNSYNYTPIDFDNLRLH